MKFNLNGLTDPTYNSPVINVETKGSEVRIDTERAQGCFFDIVSLELSNLKRSIILQSIKRYEQDTAEGSKVSSQYLACALRRLAIYDRIYIPYLVSLEVPIEPSVDLLKLSFTVRPVPSIHNNDFKILIACEESQAVCVEFRKLGFEAFSCDLQECSGGLPEWHIQGDALEEAYSGKYQMMIGHPPCTYLSNAGNSYFNISRFGEKAIQRWKDRIEALEFFYKMWRAPIDLICLENPIGFVNSSLVGIPMSQVIEPWYFGDPHKKRTGLWLKGLPLLKYTVKENLFDSITACEEPEPIFIDNSGKPRYFTDAIKGHGGGRSGRQKARSKTFPGIATAMAKQWSEFAVQLSNKEDAA